MAIYLSEKAICGLKYGVVLFIQLSVLLGLLWIFEDPLYMYLYNNYSASSALNVLATIMIVHKLPLAVMVQVSCGGISLRVCTNIYPEFICYDDGCHLRKYAMNKCRCDLTQTTKILSKLDIVIDKMHMAGHVDSWCKEVCDPSLYPDLASHYECSALCG